MVCVFFLWVHVTIAAAVFPHPAVEFYQPKNCIPKSTSVWPLGTSHTDFFLSFSPVSTFYFEIQDDAVKFLTLECSFVVADSSVSLDWVFWNNIITLPSICLEQNPALILLFVTQHGAESEIIFSTHIFTSPTSCRLCVAAAGLVLVRHMPDTPGLLDLLVFSSQWPPLSTVSHSHMMPIWFYTFG